ncbi:hypothetical protein C8R42DRAFT_640230 [Lentinula raphanica]|nr:hypothetical protein C8R42DRAFT_640230 [Lentinula raphanica]
MDKTEGRNEYEEYRGEVKCQQRGWRRLKRIRENKAWETKNGQERTETRVNDFPSAPGEEASDWLQYSSILTDTPILLVLLRAPNPSSYPYATPSSLLRSPSLFHFPSKLYPPQTDSGRENIDMMYTIRVRFRSTSLLTSIALWAIRSGVPDCGTMGRTGGAARFGGVAGRLGQIMNGSVFEHHDNLSVKSFNLSRLDFNDDPCVNSTTERTGKLGRTLDEQHDNKFRNYGIGMVAENEEEGFGEVVSKAKTGSYDVRRYNVFLFDPSSLPPLISFIQREVRNFAVEMYTQIDLINAHSRKDERGGWNGGSYEGLLKK